MGKKAKAARPKRSASGKGPRVVATVVLPTTEPEKSEALFRIFCETDPSTASLGDAVKALSARTGIPYGTLKRYPGKYGWNIRWKGHWGQKNASVPAQEVDAAIASIIQHRNNMDNVQVPFSTLSVNLKGLAYVVIGANQDMVRTASVMIRLYTMKAQRIMDRWVEHKGGLASISKTDEGLIEAYMAKARTYYQFVPDYMRPSGLVAMLDQIGMKEALGVLPDGLEEAAFTPAALLRKLEKLGLSHGGGLRNTIGDAELIDEVQAEILEDMPDAPEVDGTKVRDDENQLNLDRPEDYVEKRKVT